MNPNYNRNGVQAVLQQNPVIQLQYRVQQLELQVKRLEELIINNNKQIHEAINAISKNIETTHVNKAEIHDNKEEESHETFNKGSLCLKSETHKEPLNESENNDDNDLENIDLDNL